MQKENNKNKNLKGEYDSEIERQRQVDKGGTQIYGRKKSKNNKKDDNVLIDSEH